MVELADTQDLGSCIARCAGSSPVIRTIRKRLLERVVSFLNKQLKSGLEVGAVVNEAPVELQSRE